MSATDPGLADAIERVMRTMCIRKKNRCDIHDDEPYDENGNCTRAVKAAQVAREDVPDLVRQADGHNAHAALAPELLPLLRVWDETSSATYSKSDAAADLRAALRQACGCQRGLLPHDRRCPDRLERTGTTRGGGHS